MNWVIRSIIEKCLWEKYLKNIIMKMYSTFLSSSRNLFSGINLKKNETKVKYYLEYFYEFIFIFEINNRKYFSIKII